jgi:hypothetical protein
MRTLRFPVRFAVILALLWSDPEALAARAPVTTCGQEVFVPAELTADLDCSAFEDAAIRMIAGSLDFNGYTLRASPNGLGVLCVEGRCCRIKGPGKIEGGDSAIRSFAKNLRVQDLEISGAGAAIRQTGHGPLTARRVIAIGNGGGFGSNGILRVIDSTIVDSDNAGLGASLVRVRGSTVLGNASPETCENPTPALCADIVSTNRPQVRDTVCGTSVTNLSSLASWNVCQND